MPATEQPSAQNVVVLAGTVTGPTYHYFQRPFWHKNNATIDSTNWLRWGEFDAVTTVPIGEWTANTMEVVGSASSAANYYAGWILYNSTRSESLFITSNTTGNVLTFNEDIPSDWVQADTYVLYRHYHDNIAYQPSWTDPLVLKWGNGILAFGGQGSNVGYKGKWSGYVNQTWFSGAARTPSINGRSRPSDTASPC